MMIKTNTPRRGGWLVALAVITIGSALAAPQAAFADDKNKKEPKVPIVIGPPIVTPDPPKKK